MKAIVQDTYGSADVLEFRDIPVPTLGEHDVLVRVVAAGVDRGAWHFMTGQPYLMRIIGFGFRAPKIPVPGTNVAGIVEAIGPAVTNVTVGDEIYGVTRGAYAEYAMIGDTQLAAKPPTLSFEEASVLPYAGFAALQGLRERGRLRPDERVLIVGASGAVGAAAVQLAKALGGHVTGISSSSTLSFVRELGADEVVDYRSSALGARGEKYDLVLDIAGRTSVMKLRRLLTRRGRLVIVGGEVGRWTGLRRQVWAMTLSPFVSQRMGTFVVKQNTESLEDLSRFVAAGQLRPAVRRTYPLVEAADAVRALDEPHQTGRVAITL
jgi:NADPH:quinone reductase-like Zn-dependent oxidoreductase